MSSLYPVARRGLRQMAGSGKAKNIARLKVATACGWKRIYCRDQVVTQPGGKGGVKVRAVVQRVTRARVEVQGETLGSIGRGLVVLLGVQEGDTSQDADYMAEKLAHLRVFSDAQDRMNLSLLDIEGEALVVSQFTLLGDCRKGRRPSFIQAAPPREAEALYLEVVERLRQKELQVAQGRFQATMEVIIHNDGPVTLLLDSYRIF